MKQIEWNKVSPKELPGNPFRMIGDDWTLITAGTPEHWNTMTASWGGLGVIWNKNVATVYVRPQRYTYEFMEQSDTFTLTFFTEDYRKALNFCGTKSGRDYDKAKECGLTPVEAEGGVTFEEARLVLVCKKLYWDDLTPEHFCCDEIDAKNYPGKDYHRLYIGEIIGAYMK